MGYVYRYTDLSDNIIKYVGIVWGETRTLKQRIREHIRANWYEGTSWKIEYINANIDSRTDAEYFESHYISLYGTDKYFNSAKKGWGISKFLPDRENEWKCYKEEDFSDSKTPLDSVNEILAYKSYDERKHYCMGLSNFLSRGTQGDSKEADKYKDTMNEQLNILLFGENWHIAHFNGYGEILIDFPGFKNLRYVDYEKSFVSPFDGTLVKSDVFISYLKRYLEKYLSTIVDTINDSHKLEGGETV